MRHLRLRSIPLADIGQLELPQCHPRIAVAIRELEEAIRYMQAAPQFADSSRVSREALSRKLQSHLATELLPRQVVVVNGTLLDQLCIPGRQQ